MARHKVLIINKSLSGTLLVNTTAIKQNANKNQTAKQEIMTTNKATSRSEMLNRILRSGSEENVCGIDPLPVKTNIMITKVSVRPNPFYTVLTMDVYCESNKNIIVRMFNADGRIVKMFSWYLVKGTNVTAINELGSLDNGHFILDIIDNEGNVLFSTRLTKE